VFENMVALTGIEPANSRFSPVQLSLGRLVGLGDSGRGGAGVCPARQRSWTSCSRRIRDPLGGFWGDSGVHGWVNSGKDG
jgi:hypothetical protein